MEKSSSIALGYAHRGWSSIPIPPKSKRPTLKNWQKLRLAETNIERHFEGDCNIGILLGEPSGWLIDVDLDHPLAVELADLFLPPTGSEFGRAGKPRSHRLYVVTAPVRTTKWQSNDRVMIVELRSNGCQTLFPGSIHPNGESIEWSKEGVPAKISPSVLLAALNALAGEVRQRLHVKPMTLSVVKRVGNDLDRARKYLAKIPPAISGQGGHDVTFRTACTLIQRFGLERNEAFALLSDWNKKCDPPWSNKELFHKIDDARTPRDEYGHLENRSNNGHSTKRDRVEVTPDEHEVNDAVVKALAKHPELFMRGDVLVQLVQGDGQESGILRFGKQPHLRAMRVPNVREALSRYVYFYSLEDNGDGIREVQRHPPGWCCAAVTARGSWRELRTITGLTTVPVLLPDGSLLQTPGFDRTSGLLYLPRTTIPKIVDSPTPNDAKEAVSRLLHLVADFPFAGSEHRSAWLAALFTPLARYAFDGPSPMFLFDANTRGSGKTLLADLIGEIVTGRNLPRMTCPREDEESRKRITALAIAGDPLILLDNIAGSLGSPSLDAALTGTEWEDRILGKSEMVRMPLTAVWYATGNNVAIHADTSRRIIFVRLESPDERPEERTGFQIPNLLAHVRAKREEYLIDALTCLRAFYVAGKPLSEGKPLGSYEGWSREVRDCICWLGLADPSTTRDELMIRSDRTAEVLAGLVNGLLEADPDRDGLTSAEIIRLVEGGEPAYETLRTAVLEACDTGGKVSTRKLGNILARYRGRVCAGKAIDCRKPGGISWWFVRNVISGTQETKQHEQHEQLEVSQIVSAANASDNLCGSGGSGGSASAPKNIAGRVQVTI